MARGQLWLRDHADGRIVPLGRDVERYVRQKDAPKASAEEESCPNRRVRNCWPASQSWKRRVSARRAASSFGWEKRAASAFTGWDVSRSPYITNSGRA